MNFCDNLLKEIFSFLGKEYISYHSVSKQWKSVVRAKVNKEETLWNFLFPDFTPPKGCPLNTRIGELKSEKNIIEKIENWLVKYYGAQKYKNYKNLALEPLYCEKSSEKLFTDEWNEYFKSVENRIYMRIPLFKILGISTDLRPGAFSVSKAENLLLTFKLSDSKDRQKIIHLTQTKDWMCWERVYDDEDLVGFSFNKTLWKNLEIIYSYVTGNPPRDIPNFPDYVDIEDSEETGVDIREICKYL